MKLDKLKELVLILISIILIIFIINYLKIIKYLGLILTILIPVFIGFIYAWLFNPLIKKLSKKHQRNFICISLFLFIIFIIILFFYILIPILYKEISELISILPPMFNKLNNKINNLGLKDILDKSYIFLTDNLPLFLVNSFKSLFKYFGLTIIGLILGLYISMDYEKIINNIYNIIPSKIKCIFETLTKEASEEVRKCVNGTLFVAFCVFLMDSLLFFIFHLDAFLLLGILCGLTDLIPYIGPYIGGLAASIVGFTESTTLGIITLICCVIVQSIENYILQPLVMSKSIKISPILIIIGLLLFGNLFGIIGMILSTPIIAMLKVLIIHLKRAITKCQE